MNTTKTPYSSLSPILRVCTPHRRRTLSRILMRATSNTRRYATNTRYKYDHANTTRYSGKYEQLHTNTHDYLQAAPCGPRATRARRAQHEILTRATINTHGYAANTRREYAMQIHDTNTTKYMRDRARIHYLRPRFLRGSTRELAGVLLCAFLLP